MICRVSPACTDWCEQYPSIIGERNPFPLSSRTRVSCQSEEPGFWFSAWIGLSLAGGPGGRAGGGDEGGQKGGQDEGAARQRAAGGRFAQGVVSFCGGGRPRGACRGSLRNFYRRWRRAWP